MILYFVNKLFIKTLNKNLFVTTMILIHLFILSCWLKLNIESKTSPKGLCEGADSEAAVQGCSENMQQIYRRTPMTKCDFNKVAKLLHI